MSSAREQTQQRVIGLFLVVEAMFLVWYLQPARPTPEPNKRISTVAARVNQQAEVVAFHGEVEKAVVQELDLARERLKAMYELEEQTRGQLKLAQWRILGLEAELKIQRLNAAEERYLRNEAAMRGQGPIVVAPALAPYRGQYAEDMPQQAIPIWRMQNRQGPDRSPGWMSRRR